MAYFQTCPKCGCNLDPGENCECEKEKLEEEGRRQKFYSTEKNGQMGFLFIREEDNVKKEVV